MQITELSARNPLTEQDKSFNSPIKKEAKSVSKAVIENASDVQSFDIENKITQKSDNPLTNCQIDNDLYVEATIYCIHKI